jgi:hypothetical protein
MDERLSRAEFRRACAARIVRNQLGLDRGPANVVIDCFLAECGAELDAVIKEVQRTTAIGFVHSEIVGFRPDPPPAVGDVLDDVLQELHQVGVGLAHPRPAAGFLPGFGDTAETAAAGPYRRPRRGRGG